TGWRVTRGLAYVLAALDYLMLVWLLDLGRLGSGALLMAAAAALLAVSQSPTVRRLGAADERTLRGAAYVLALITTEMALGAAARLHVMLALLADVGLLAGSAYADRARRFGVAWRWAAALLFVIPWVQAATLLFPGESPAATVSLALLSGLYLAAAFVQRHRSAATALPLTAAALLLAPIAGLIAVGERNTALGAFVLFASACAYAGVAVASGRSWLLALALPQVNLALFLAPVAVDRRLPQDNPDLFLWSQVALSLAYLFGARLAEV
ncbi:MAG: hypothetical protein NTZ05_11165, partial [Chloroflexi bacterium]|nr:hypothetical protein [Chloroflexota bacterium]